MFEFEEPNEIHFNVDGQTDPCTKNEDINFNFKGFGLSGKVITYGDFDNEYGPPNIDLKLIDSKKQLVVDQTQSLADGSYYFSNVMPGDYQIAAGQNSNLKFKQNSVNVVLSKENWSSKEDIIVAGHSIQGQALTKDKQPLMNAIIYLSFNSQKQVHKQLDTSGFDCDHQQHDTRFICSTKTDSQGKYKFNNIAYGSYSLSARLESDHVQYVLKPATINVDLLQHKSIQIDEKFELNRVSSVRLGLFASSGRPLLATDTKVFLNGEPVASVGSNQFELKNLDTGKYTLKIDTKDLFFDDVHFDVDLSLKALQQKTLSNLLRTITATKVHLCGSVRVKDELIKATENLYKKIQIGVYEKKRKQLVNTVGLDDNFGYCVRVNMNTDYYLKASVQDDRVGEVLRLIPSERHVSVEQTMVVKQNFEQFEAKLSGFVEFLNAVDCKPDMRLKLSSLKTDWHKEVLVDCASMTANKVRFQIDGIGYGLGSYKLNTNYDKVYCWNDDNLDNLNLNADIKEIGLKQTGYKIKFEFDFEMAKPMDIVLSDNKIRLKPDGGLCLADRKAKYVMDFNNGPEFCRSLKTTNEFLKKTDVNRFELDQGFFHDANILPVRFETESFRFLISLELDKQHADPIRVQIFNSENSLVDEVLLRAQKTSTILKSFVWLKSHEQFRIVPESAKHMFEPIEITVQVNRDDCSVNKAEFKASLGYFIIGHIKHQTTIDDIQMRVKNAEMLTESTISSNPGYKLGPYKANSLEFINVELVKDGYLIVHETKKITDDGYLVNEYSMDKLGELFVHVNLNSTSDNILVSLSSSNKKFRRTLKTDKNGDIKFANLESGSYYLLFMMQEYEFEPSSQVVEISNGNSVQTVVNANRVAYSCFGKHICFVSDPFNLLSYQMEYSSQKYCLSSIC